MASRKQGRVSGSNSCPHAQQRQRLEHLLAAADDGHRPGQLALHPAPAGEAESGSEMPPMGTILTLRELRDLMAYLRTLKEP